MSVVFVAEVSSNHHRDLSRCLTFIDKAAEIGCGAVKFQLFRIRELFAPEILARREELRKREAWELPVGFLPELSARSRAKGIRFGCSPFYLEAVKELLPHVDFYKIASYELLWGDLLRACARTGKPVVLSTGMATLGEVDKAVATLMDAGCGDLTILHCVSGYPAPVGECNLSAIATIRDHLHHSPFFPRLRFGWSDHSVNPGVVLRAVHRWGAEMVELHLDLEGEGEEFRTGHCWLPEQVRSLVASTRDGWSADGSGEKVPGSAESREKDWRADPEDGLRPLRKVRQASSP
jgi:N-acetylneuraminate synthase